MGIKIASLFASIGADTSGLEKGLTSSGEKLGDFGKKLASSVLGVASLGTALYKAGQFALDATKDWATYVEEVYHAANAAGVTTESMSRLIQVADDYRVSQETLISAMAMARKNGFVPTVDSMSSLSDKYLALGSSTERAEMLTKIFGRSYAEIEPLMQAGGAAIMESASKIDDSLVVTEAAAQATKEYWESVDALGDAWTGFKNSIGQGLVPVLTSVTNAVNAGRVGDELAYATQVKLQNARDQQIITGDEYIAMLDMLYVGTQDVESITARAELTQNALNEVYRKNAAQTPGVIEATDMTAESMVAASIAAKQQEKEINAIQLTAARAEYEATANTLKDQLAAAYREVKDAEDAWKQGTAGEIKVELDTQFAEKKITIEQYKAALDLLDKTYGTKYSMEFEFKESIPDLVKALLNDPASFAEKASAFEDYFLPLMTSADAAELKIGIIQRKLQKLARSYNVRINIITTTGQPTTTTTTPDYLEVEPTGDAMGGYELAGKSYLVGESGPELFVPQTNGRVVNNLQTNAIMQGGNNAELLGALSRLPTAREIATAVRDALILAGA